MNNLITFAIIIIALLIFLVFYLWLFRDKTQPLEPKRQRGQVSYVIDGDTLILGGSKTRLRLWGVDAPEKDAEGFQRARNALVGMVEGRQVSFIEIEKDRYGRTVARVFVKKQEINRAMIESGTTREYCRFSKGFYGFC